MYDLSDELMTFYNNHVKLPQNKIDELFEKKDINIERLKSGLSKYNEENNTDYHLEETYVQGSVGMHTVTQSEEDDYDIDVGILINEEKIDEIGSGKIKNVILNAFEKIDVSFNTPPERLTNCIRFTYASGYQIDFAVYRNAENPEHAGSEWRERNPEAIQGWFDLQKLLKGEYLPIIIQLLKMFNNSRNGWKMPGGLITTILVEESLATGYTRIDEILYYTLKNIIDRLNKDEDVKSPVFPYKSILYNEKDRNKIEVFKNRLISYLEKLEALTKLDCSRLEALEAWGKFFNHTYWDKLYSEEEQNKYGSEKEASSKEEYIHEKYPVTLKYAVKIDANVGMDGFRNTPLQDFINRFSHIPKSKTIDFYLINTDTPKPYDVYWKVRNVGPEAYKRDMIRGQIINKNMTRFTETSTFKGPHFVECYIIKDGICVAKTRLDVPI